jgi:hypothetical protein
MSLALHDGAGCRRREGLWFRSWNQKVDQTGFSAAGVAQAIEKLGEPSGIRTLDPLIKSQVLYRLS